MNDLFANRVQHPVGFWFYVSGCLGVLALLWWVVMEVTDYGLLRFMAAGVLLIVACLILGPSTLDMTGWTLFVMALMPLGLILLIGSPLAYALWVAFVSPHVSIGVH